MFPEKIPGIIYIYALRDPGTNEIRYVGATNDPQRRLWQHTVLPTKTEKWAWIQGLLAKGLVPLIEVLEPVPDWEWVDAEKRWIAQLRAAGAPLLNSSIGGIGPLGHRFSAEQREQMSRARKGIPRVLSERALEVLRGMSDARRGKPSPVRGRPLSAEHRAKIAAALRGKPKSAEFMERARLARRDPAYRAMLSARRKGWNPSPETRARMSAARKRAFAEGRRDSEETRRRRSESLRRYWERRRAGES